MGKRSEKIHYQRRYSDGKQAHEKMLNIMLLGNCKLKQKWDTTQLLEWLKSKTLTAPNVDVDVEQQEHSFCASESWIDASTLEDNLAVSYKAKHNLTNSQSPRYLSKWVKTLPYENLCTNIYSSSVCNCQEVEAPRGTSRDEWINKWVHPYNEILFSNIKKWVIKLWKKHRGNINACC